VDGGDGVFCLVVADHFDFTIAGAHQGDHLPCRPHKRLAVALELDLADWVNLPDHSASLSIQDNPVTETLPSAVMPTQDGDGLGVDLRDDGDSPRREAWDLDQNPGLCSQPEHLHRAKTLVIVTLSACDVALLV